MHASETYSSSDEEPDVEESILDGVGTSVLAEETYADSDHSTLASPPIKVKQVG